MSYKVFSPAKVNLSLQILGRRDDGYHDIDSVFAKLKFGDELIFEDKNEGIEIRSRGKYKVPTNADNLVYKAADLIRQRAKGKRGIRITIDKQIPIGAGMGGGSSNAAMTLKFLNDHWDVGLSQEKLEEIGKTLGADVVFFLQEESVARMQGIGEKVVLLDGFAVDKSSQMLLFIPKYISISSVWAYKKLVEYYNGDYAEAKKVDNAFEAPIFEVFPDLENIKKALQDFGALQANMTGSGSVVFGVFDVKKDLSEIQSKLELRGDCILTQILR